MDKDESLKQEPIRGWFTADEFVEMADRRTKEWAKQADIPDLIAGALGVSRGTAYDMMREALKEALLVQEPEIVQRVRRYAGQTMRTARNPNITARECIELANWLAANTTPPTAQRQWVDLMDEDIGKIRDCPHSWKPNWFARAVEAKLKEKNSG